MHLKVNWNSRRMWKKRVLFIFLATAVSSLILVIQTLNIRQQLYVSKMDKDQEFFSKENKQGENYTNLKELESPRDNTRKSWFDKVEEQVSAATNPPAITSCQVDYIMSGKKTKKIVFYVGPLWSGMGSILQFHGCEYSNCIFQTCDNMSYVPAADTVIFAHNSKNLALTVAPNVRQRQLWLVYGVESPAYERYKWRQPINDFNGTLTYTQSSSPESMPYGFVLPIERDKAVTKLVDYAKGKTKGAYAYVSNCNSMFYDRLQVMKELSKYIEVDIYGSCTGIDPCPIRFDVECEAKTHYQYRFYLAFENSLCTEYITEKFYRSLYSEGFYIPIALGGLTVQEYDRVFPPNSFIHVYNFSSIEALGKHLQVLVNDDAAFNAYHEWRNRYQISLRASKERICDLCKVVNHPDMLRSNTERRFADEWNDSKNCRNYTII